MEQISHLNWIYFNDANAFETSVAKLNETLNTDLEVLKEHTRLLIRAREWEKKGHSPSLLLRGDDLEQARKMLTNPDITDLQKAYLEASSLRERRTQIAGRCDFDTFETRAPDPDGVAFCAGFCRGLYRCGLLDF